MWADLDISRPRCRRLNRCVVFNVELSKLVTNFLARFRLIFDVGLHLISLGVDLFHRVSIGGRQCITCLLDNLSAFVIHVLPCEQLAQSAICLQILNAKDDKQYHGRETEKFALPLRRRIVLILALDLQAELVQQLRLFRNVLLLSRGFGFRVLGRSGS